MMTQQPSQGSAQVLSPVPPDAASVGARAPLTAGHGRRITYLRVSVTDRCDLRCRYCMAEEMTFLPRSSLLAVEEIAAIAESSSRGV